MSIIGGRETATWEDVALTDMAPQGAAAYEVCAVRL